MKVVYDTCLYIDLLRASLHLDLFSDRNQIRYLSPVVLMELTAGTVKPSDKKIVDQLLAPYIQANRVINLAMSHFYKAGLCVAQINQNNRLVGRNLVQDILIAYSAKAVGAVLFTKNKKDFQLIQRHLSFTVEYL